MKRNLLSIFSGLSAAFTICALLIDCSPAFELTVLHTNDLHSRFEEISASGSQCRSKDKAKGKCYGGVARLKATVDAIKAKEPNVILLNGGDFFQGTVWYSMFKWQIVANLTSTIGYTASSLGNHEFDDGVSDLASYAEAVSPSAYPLLACNIDLRPEPAFRGKEKLIKCAHVVNVGGRKVGIIGYVTPETRELASTGKVVFHDEVESLQKAADKLRKVEGVDIIIAVGHSGYNRDLEIASEVKGLDLVVGGHTNTFLWNDPDSVKSQLSSKDYFNVQQGAISRKVDSPIYHGMNYDSRAGPYPTVVNQTDTGRRVPVVQTSGYGKYLGKIHLTFDDRTGELLSYSDTNPIPLHQSLPEDPDLERIVKAYGEKVNERMGMTVGESKVFLDGGRPKCRLEECSFGNFMADAMASEMEVEIAVLNSGAIKGSFRKGDVTMEDVFTAMPWSNTIDVITIPGFALKQMLEHSVSQYDETNPDPGGRFLQVSGLIVAYDVRQPQGSRLRSIYKGSPQSPDSWAEIDDDKNYEVAAPSFLVSGGDRYAMVPENLVYHLNTGYLDNDLIVKYLKEFSPITKVPAAGRISIVSHGNPSANNLSQNSASTDVSTSSSFILVVSFMTAIIGEIFTMEF